MSISGRAASQHGRKIGQRSAGGACHEYYYAHRQRGSMRGAVIVARGATRSFTKPFESVQEGRGV